MDLSHWKISKKTDLDTYSSSQMITFLSILDVLSEE